LAEHGRELTSRKSRGWIEVALSLVLVPLFAFGVYRWGVWVAAPPK
jgi:hypothetical protein